MSGWINFKELRALLDFEKVLQHYGVEVHRKGNQHLGFCPLPMHQGKRNSPSFSANLERGIFQCFGCGASGNMLEFAALMEGVSSKDGQVLRSVALKLRDRFCPTVGQTSPGKSPQGAKPRLLAQQSDQPVLVNAPLDFELKELDQNHAYLASRGFSANTIKLFGLGYCSRGAMKGRLAIPLHDQKGRLIGYAGRVVDDASVNQDNPKYRFPSKRTREGKTYEFRKTRFLYNGFRIQAPLENLIVVEGFVSVWWLTQHGFQNSVAVMGSDCSDKQAELIVSLVNPNGRIWIVPDGDEAGKRCAESLLRHVSPHRFVKWVKLEKDVQPTALSLAQIQACMCL